jgi:hypothetical protein
MTMDKNKGNRTFLRAVESPVKRVSVPNHLFNDSWQQNLFTSPNPGLLCIIDFLRISEYELLHVIDEARPRFVVDLRIVPRFDVGSLNRKVIFSLFEKSVTRYLDMSGILGLRDRRDVALNPPILIQHLITQLASSQHSSYSIEGPVIFFVDPPQADKDYVDTFVESFQSLRSGGWEFLKFPVEIR